MSNILKGILVFATGAVIGGYVSYAITTKKCERILEEEAAEWRKLKEKERERIREQKERLIKEAEAIDQTSSSVEVEKEVSESDIATRRRATKDNYDKIVSKMQYKKEEEKEIEEIYHDHRVKKDAKNRPNYTPYVITIDEFTDEKEHYDKITLYFYEDDEVLTEENEEVIDNVNYLVGLESLEKFGEGSRDPEVVYVRNERLEVDYEIIRLSKSYSETVLGILKED